MEDKAQSYDLDPRLKAKDADEVGLRVVLWRSRERVATNPKLSRPGQQAGTLSQL